MKLTIQRVPADLATMVGTLRAQRAKALADKLADLIEQEEFDSRNDAVDAVFNALLNTYANAALGLNIEARCAEALQGAAEGLRSFASKPAAGPLDSTPGPSSPLH